MSQKVMVSLSVFLAAPIEVEVDDEGNTRASFAYSLKSEFSAMLLNSSVSKEVGDAITLAALKLITEEYSAQVSSKIRSMGGMDEHIVPHTELKS